MEEEILLDVRDLTVGFGQKKAFQPVIDALSFTVKKGEILGIVGESGSGKSMTALTLMDLLPRDAIVRGGMAGYHGKNLLAMGKEELRKIKGVEMAMIYQEPMTSLNPVMKIGAQVEEVLCLHGSKSREERKAEVLALFSKVGLEEGEALLEKYPHQLSGGMRQRVMIAMAIIGRPGLLIADEPTTALDVTIQAQILDLIRSINEEYGMSVILISHDLGVIKKACGRALVLSGGRLVEENTVHQLFYHPVQEYTQKLLKAVPRREKTDLFTREHEKREKALETASVILKVEELDVFYRERRKSFFQKDGRRQAVRDVTFTLRRGEILGIVGESGSGKSTLAKAVSGLIEDTAGRITVNTGDLRMVFQDPYASLNPAKKVEWILKEPLRIRGGYTRNAQNRRVLGILQDVGLEEAHLKRYVSQLSGGQRQRVSIACALILHPKILILDEPVSALDVTVQDQILRLLLSLREKYDLSYLFISHDLNVIYRMCDRVGVMYRGKIVELEASRDLYQSPRHPYTRKLLQSIPEF